MATPDASNILATLGTLPLKDPTARKSALALSRQLTTALEDPVNTATELVLSPFVATAARIAVDLDLFAHIFNASEPPTTAALAEATKCELQLLSEPLTLTQPPTLIHYDKNTIFICTKTS